LRHPAGLRHAGCHHSHHIAQRSVEHLLLLLLLVLQILDGVVSDSFIRNWLDLLSFLLSGLPANGTIAAEVAFMVRTRST
jgi:hypothetical protein